MKAVLEFDLPEENDEHRDACDGPKWKMVVRDMDEWARSMIKYQGVVQVETQQVRDKIHELVEWEGLDLG